LDRVLTEAFDVAYKAFLNSQEDSIGFTTRAHATLQNIGDYVIYSRKQRDKMAMFITKTLVLPVNVVGSEFFLDTYFSQVVPGSLENDEKETLTVFLVRDGCVEIRNERLILLHRIEMTSNIKKDIPNITTSNGKRRLINYKVND